MQTLKVVKESVFYLNVHRIREFFVNLILLKQILVLAQFFVVTQSFIQLQNHLLVILFGFFLLADAHALENHLAFLHHLLSFHLEALQTEALSLENPLHQLQRSLDRLQTLLTAHVEPGVLDVRQLPLVQSLHVLRHQR